VEGNSIRATCRMTGAAKGTVIKLLEDVGAACKRYHDEHVFMLESKRVQVDEIWSFCYSKEKNIPADMLGVFGVGDVGRGLRCAPIPSSSLATALTAAMIWLRGILWKTSVSALQIASS